jgi:pimeloyl-ACP methyl ester carboxylesterase
MFVEKTYQADQEALISYSDTDKFDADKPVLIFLHGLGGDLAAFNEFRARFYKKGFRSLAIDFRGHGMSARTKSHESYSFEALISDVFGIIKKEKIEKYILVGHCLGGLVAQVIATSSPEGLEKLVLLSTSSSGFSLLQKTKFTMLIKKFAELLSTNLPTNHKGGRIDHDKFKGTGDFHPYRIFNDIFNTSLSSYGHVLSYALNFTILRKLPKIIAPTLIIAGGDDKIFSVQHSKMMHENIPNSDLKIYDKGNHLFIFVATKAVTKDIFDFIA